MTRALHRIRFVVTLCSVHAIAAAALAQNGLPYTIAAPPDSIDFGSRVASGGDADNDGSDDIFVVDDAADPNGFVFGRWYMYSGIDGSLLWSAAGQEPAEMDWHFACEFLGDVDGDHCDDIILGREGLNGLRGGADVLSGRTGEVLYSYRGVDPDDRLGRGLTGLEDIDGDHVPDFAFTSRFTESGAVSMRSGADGSEIRHVEMPWPRRLRDAGDIDGDHLHDLAVGSNAFEAQTSFIRLISGADGVVIREISAPDPHDFNFGYEITAGVDVDGDGAPDLLASGWFSSQRAYVLSGRTGAVIAVLTPDAQRRTQLLGVNLRFADVTGDGVAEAVVGGAERILICNPLTGHIISSRTKYEFRDSYSGTEMATGDVNGDGLADIIVGLTDFNVSGGNVDVTSGGRLLLRQEFPGEYPRDIVQRGWTAEFEVYSGAPGRPIHLLGSARGHDCTFVHRLGICIDLTPQIYDLGEAVTDGAGFAHFDVDVPPHAPLITLWLQALDVHDPARGPITSNVLEIDIVD